MIQKVAVVVALTALATQTLQARPHYDHRTVQSAPVTNPIETAQIEKEPVNNLIQQAKP